MTGTLLIEHPEGYAAERRYIFDVLLKEFLGLDYHARPAARLDLRVTLAGDPYDRELVLPDILLATPTNAWLTPAALPPEPLARWDAGRDLPDARLVAPSVPAIYARTPYFRETDGRITLGLDLFGSAFYMLARYEELVGQARDAHDRFPATASLAWRAGFLDRPIVNEYVEVLWTALDRLWPGRLMRRARAHEVRLSHDIDWPLCTAGRPLPRALKAIAADLLKRHSPVVAARRLAAQRRALRGNPNADPCNTFEFIMDVSERHGLRSAFYVIADHTAGEIDGCYALTDPWIAALLQRIHARGHALGLHPSYHTYRDGRQTRREFEILRRTLETWGIRQERWGGRQHFLRWRNPETWQNWEDAGLAYDSTLGYADWAGFRCGTCYSYPTFNLRTRRALQLRERPLVAMDVTLTGYMGLSHSATLSEIERLNATCRLFDGEFTLLWHNNNLVSRAEKELYRRVVAAVAEDEPLSRPLSTEERGARLAQAATTPHAGASSYASTSPLRDEGVDR
jgi:hypothetical protein